MPVFGFVAVGILKSKGPDLADIHVVGLPVPVPIAGKLRVFNDDIALGIRTRQDAILVIVKIAVGYSKPGPFQADRSAVLIRNRRSREFDIFNRRICPLNHPDAFTLGVLAMGVDMRAAAYALDGEIVAGPGGDISRIKSGIDFDRGAVLGDARGRTRRFQVAAGPYLNDLG